MAYVVIDIETTGLSRNYHKITEIAAVKVNKGKIGQQFQSLINPETRIPSFITRLTGIDNNMVKDAPVIQDVMPEFVDFLGDKIFVAHNAGFDYGFLNHNAEEEIKNPRLCTRKLANRLLPNLTSKKLEVLCRYFKINNNNAHRAMSDTLATVDVLTNFLEMMHKKGFKTPEEVIKFEKMSRRQIMELERKDI